MRIAFFGSSLLSSYWNGAATYYRGILKALALRGHRITFYEPDAFGRQQHRDMEPPDWAQVVVYPAQGTDGVERALQQASKSDLVVKASGVGVFDELLEEAVARFRRPDRLAAFWDVDAPATLDRVAANPHDPFAGLIREFDLVFTYGGGEPVVSTYRSLGARECVPIYNALDPETHFPIEPLPRFRCDLAFLGNRLPDREARVEEFFLKPAASLPSRSFLLGGNGWEDRDMPVNVRRLGHVYTADHNALNSSALAVLNIARESMARYGHSPATRVFEAAGAAACMITDAWNGIDQFFEPGKEILVARDGSDVAELVAALSPEAARRVGECALRRALAAHTYAHRAEQVDQVLDARSPVGTEAR